MWQELQTNLSAIVTTIFLIAIIKFKHKIVMASNVPSEFNFIWSFIPQTILTLICTACTEMLTIYKSHTHFVHTNQSHFINYIHAIHVRYSDLVEYFNLILLDITSFFGMEILDLEKCFTVKCLAASCSNELNVLVNTNHVNIYGIILQYMLLSNDNYYCRILYKF